MAFTETFTERNTVLPGLILFVGGSQTDVGILTTITIGIPLISQLLFAGFLSTKVVKKPFLLSGIYMRVFAYLGVGVTLFLMEGLSSQYIILAVFFWMFLFSISGAFAGISYTDILGKSITGSTRKKFFILKQFLNSTGLLIAAIIAREFLKEFSYPQNYQVMFIAAGSLLFVASIGFTTIKEEPSNIDPKTVTLKERLSSIKSIIKKDKNLLNFVIASNLIGLTLTLIPFYVVLAKNSFNISESDIGNYLLLQIIGMVISNLVWGKVVKKGGFKRLLYTTAILFGIIPLLAILAAFNLSAVYYSIIFFINGAALSVYKITKEGVVIEISNEVNRAMYRGIFGTFNLIPAIFPLIYGLLLSFLGFIPVFTLAAFFTLISVIFIKRMVCPIDLERIAKN